MYPGAQYVGFFVPHQTMNAALPVVDVQIEACIVQQSSTRDFLLDEIAHPGYVVLQEISQFIEW